jgi:nicotinamidase-related amidase
MSNVALLLMDFQIGIADKTWAASAIGQAASARDAARRNGILTVFTHVSFRPGLPDVSPRNKVFWGMKEKALLPTGPAYLVPGLRPSEGDLMVAKNRFCAFAGNDLDTLLRAQSVTRLVLAGVGTSGVVLSTALVATDLDFEVIVLSDACADEGKLHQVLMTEFFSRSCEVSSTQDWARSLAA